ncbi:DUF4097 family beta strand repeat-containing protein [Streptomyces erythrochromogenes]|uniref:DUF4097 family beta strand repeat-containing protein n=1 Tax=Streptomyces erythrochromogenes TaxID=285574 RepID=UPI003449F434
MSNFEIVGSTNEPTPRTTDILLAEAAKDGTVPTRSFTGDERVSGPILATVKASAATVWVAVDPSVTTPQVRVYCTDPDSPFAQAARDTRIEQSGEYLSVTVPPVTPAATSTHRGTSTYISGSGSSYSFGSMHINGGATRSVNGATFSAGASGSFVNGHRGIEVELLLPTASGLKADVSSGTVRTFGHMAAAQIESSAGSVHLESVGRAEVKASAGSVRIGQVAEWADVHAAAGSITVTSHTGHAARVRASAGSIKFTIAPEATGYVDLRASAGSITLHGSRRTDIQITAESPAGTVRRH